MIITRSNFDTPWKNILDIYFQPFMTMCYPEAAKQIDWSKGYEPLDKELTAITKKYEIKTRVVDKLVRVWRLDGGEIWVLLHLEVQGQFDSHFPERMFIYHYRIFDRYHKPIMSMALLIDDQASWRPATYMHELWGCKLQFDFVQIKLLDFESKKNELINSNNPFAIVILAQLAALKTRQDERSRYSSKLRLTRSLYCKGWDKTAIFDLYQFIDWVMALSQPLEIEYLNEIEQFEQEKQMKYITSAERIGMQRGLQKGLEQGLEQGLEKGIQKGERAILLRVLERKFKIIPLRYQNQIEYANEEKLLEWADMVISAKSLDEIFN